MLTIERLSQIISYDLFTSFEIGDLGVISHIVVENISKGTLNAELAVLLPFNSKGAVSLDATYTVIFLDLHI